MIGTRRFLDGALGFTLILTGACAQGVEFDPDAALRPELMRDAGEPEFDASEMPEEEDSSSDAASDERDAGMVMDARASERDGTSLDAASADAELEASTLGAISGDANTDASALDAAAPAYSCASCALKVQWNTSTTSASSQSIAGYLKLTNTGSSAIALSGVTVRYWLREAMAESMVVECYHWDDGKGANKCTRPNGAATNVYTNLNVRVGSGAGDLRYVELSFPVSAGELAVDGTAPGALQLALHLPSYAAMTQSDDPSFDAALTASTTSMLFDAPKISAYLGGKLAWGVEP